MSLALLCFDVGVPFDTGTGGAVEEERWEEKSATKTKKKQNKKATTPQRNQLFSLCKRRSLSDELGLIFIRGAE